MERGGTTQEIWYVSLEKQSGVYHSVNNSKGTSCE
jgi:hypothetical protein